MKRGMTALVAALGLAALMVAGCAQKEVVKSEEPVTTAPAKVDEVKPAEQPKVASAKTEAEKQMEAANAPAESAFETIYFDFDRSDLRKDARDILTQNAEIMLKKKPDMKVRIEGNCDERGSAEYNLALGERRAKSALQYLITLGVPADRLSIISYGKEKPAVAGQDEAAWAKNRRDDFIVVK